MKLLIVCDPPVGKPDANVGGTHGVIGNLRGEIEHLGHKVELITCEHLSPVPAGESAYPLVCKMLDEINFSHIHIATQGRLGLLAIEYCVTRGLKYTAAYHTQIPEYMEIRHGFPKEIGYGFHRRVLSTAEKVIVPAPEMARLLEENGISNVVSCMHGVNTQRFYPGKTGFLDHLPRPLWLSVGRLVPEKNIEAFLELDLPGTKVVVGDGPSKRALEAQYPAVHFAGVQMGDKLAEYFRECDCFVFPSLTDTFGLVILEAMASGLPVAAFPVMGPIDVITDPSTGCMDKSLRKAALAAIKLSPEKCRSFALQHSWTEAAKRFLSHQVKATTSRQRRIVKPGNPHIDQLEMLVWEAQRLLFSDELDEKWTKKKSK
jgi:glycosyltransferase involved in cell wall biosynthesis